MTDAKNGFDFRSKMTVFALSFFLAATLTHDLAVCLALLFLMIYLILQGYVKAGFIYFIIGTGIFFIRLCAGQNGFSIFVPDVFLFAVLRMLAVTMAVHAIIRMSPGEVTAVLLKMHLPKNLALPIVFMLRFAPTIRSEFAAVFASMRMRGLMSPVHPMRTFEYTIIPIIIRSSKVSDELAASAELRGIAFPGPHTSLRPIRFKIGDVLLVIFAVLLTAFCFYLDKQVIA
ncbi:MAG: energy-coupling factor transporter transmembrane component T [Sporolactobacillus sp.]